MFRIFRDYIYAFIGLAASLITLKLYIEIYYPSLSQDAKVAVSFICILFMWFFLENIYMKAKWGRERKYAQTIGFIADGFSEIHKLSREEPNVKSTVHACTSLCNQIAESYTLITGTKCNACIKILASDKDESNNINLKAVTFARSHDSARNPKSNTTKHWLNKNTDFLTIFENIDSPKGAYFFSNTLPFRYGYQNTSFDVYGKEPDNNPIVRYWRWALPYKSTIVMPICPSQEQTTSTLIGFLCVDSTKIGAFRKNYDVQLLAGVADGIYNCIKEISA